MVDIRSALVAHLIANRTGVLVSSRVYQDHLPDDRTLPAVTYRISDSMPLRIANYAEPDVRFTAWAYTSALAWQVADAIRLDLDRYHGQIGTVHAFSLVDNSYDGPFVPRSAPTDDTTTDGMYPVNVWVRIQYQQAMA